MKTSNKTIVSSHKRATIKMLLLLALMLVGVNVSWGQLQVTQFKKTTEYTPADDDRYYLGEKDNVTFYALGLKNNGAWSWVGNDVISQKDINGVRFVFLPQDIKNEGEPNQSYIKMQFAPGKILPGDILSVDCSDAFTDGDATDIGYRVGGSNINVTKSVTDKNVYTLTHTIAENEIIQDGSNQYIRIGKFPYHNTYIGTITVTRPVTYTIHWDASQVPTGCDAWYTLGDNETPIRTTTNNIAEGTKVVYHATDAGNNDKVINGWKRSEGNGNSDKWLNWGNSLTTYVRSSAVDKANPSKEEQMYGDLYVIPEFQNCYRILLTAGEGGSAIVYETGNTSKTSLNGNKYWQPSPNLTFEATPNPGYSFVGWYENGSPTAASTSTTWTKGTYSASPMASLNVEARFVADVATHTVTFGAIDTSDASTTMGNVTATTANGTVLTSGQSVEEGTEVTFTATPSSNDYLAWGWKENGTRNYQGATVTRTITADITMNAVFNAGITLAAVQSTSSTNYGTTRIECSGDRGTAFHTNPGTPNVQFVATPMEGATFAGWYSDDACNTFVSNDNPYIIASPNETKTLYAKFTIPENTFGIVWSADIPEGCDAWFTVNGGDTKYKESVFGLAADASIRYQATDIDNPSKMISNWTVGGNGWYNSANDRTFKINDSNVNNSNNIVTLRPNFEDAYTYKATTSAGCTVSIVAAKNDDSEQLSINGKKFSKNDGRAKITLSTSSSDGLTFDGWYEDGEKIADAADTYIITITAETKKDRTFEARYIVPQPIGGQRVKAQLTDLGKGNVPTWENGHFATSATSYNHADVFRFNIVDNNNVNNSVDNYTGIRFNANASTPFRILVYVKGETNARITTLAAGNKEYVYTWSDLGIPAASVANIERVCFAGQQNGSTDVTFENVWVEKIDDPCHTFVMYGRTGGNMNAGNYTYTLATPEGDATAVFNNVPESYNRKGYTKEFILQDQLTITAPAGKDIKAIKLITDAQASELNYNGTDQSGYQKIVDNGYEIVWTHDNKHSVVISNVNSSTKMANIAKIEVIYNNSAVLHPALKKYAKGQYIVDLSKVRGNSGFAYDNEGEIVYSCYTEHWKGNFNVEFETPQDLSGMTAMKLGYSGEKVVDAVEFYATDGTKIAVVYGTDWSNIDISEKAKLTAVKKIQFFANGNEVPAGAMDIHYIAFDIDHIAPKVALDKPSTINYTIGVGQTLNVGAHATAGEDGSGAIIWEQYDNTSAHDPMGNPTYTAQYRSTLAFTPTAEGTYYLGARAYQNCKTHIDDGNEHYAFSEPAIITVEVVKNNIYENLPLTFDGNSYEENGDHNRYYRIYVPQSICNGTESEKKNVPVVFSLHGTTNDNDPSKGGVQNFNELAEQHKFIVVYPNGRLNIPELWGRGWEATGNENEDTKFFRAIIADLKTDRAEFKLGGTKQFTSIDESRIYMTGFSNGGMMAYAEANTSANIFAAFGSISGYPINEMHMRHHNDRPVPFIHIHGTKDTFVKYSHMPTIVDNMLFRNGLALTPNEIGEGSANGGATRYKMSSYTDGEAPYIYYEIGTGSNTSDTGMGHESQCTIGDKSSMQVMWEFFEDKSLPNPVNNPFEFKARINTANNLAREHGWQTNTSSGILAQYGESGGYTTTGENVYHTIHLGNGTKGKHSIQFKADGSTTNYVMVKVTKLADFSAFNTMGKNQVSVTENVILNNVAYYVHPATDEGVISIPFNGDEGEYMITITKGGKWDNTTLQDVAIVSGEVTKGDPYDHPVDTDFGGYFNYNNRLFAQWNFDLSDGYRTNARKLQANADEHNDNRAWTANLSNTDYNGTTLNNGTVVFSNHKPLGTHIGEDGYNTDLSTYDELTYDGTYVQGATNNNLIAVAAGLKFKAPAESVKIYVDIANGQVSGAHLVVDENVKMYVPYVENSYRNDKDEFSQPQDHKDDFKNCMHHINRDILYIALNQGSIWDEWNNGHFVSIGHVKNRCIDLTEEELFRNGGDEFVNGKNYNKADYMGKAGTPCILQFNRETNIDRIGVNRNLIYSFYTEYISELGKTKPSTRFRVVGSPTGQKIANDGDTWTEYTGAIAMTYGGWMNSQGGSTYMKWGNTETTDAWTDLGVMNYEPNNSAIHFKTWGNMQPAESGTNSMPSIDGFPVVALLDTEARSGSLLPSNLAPHVANTEGVEGCVAGVDYIEKTVKDESTSEDKTVYIPNYFPECEGKYMDPVTVGAYKANITPWSLPSRGGYAKFEPSLPGVLNMNVVQNGGHAYYIADEFGNLVDQSTIFSRTGSGQTITKTNNCYTVAQTDYVKHSLNVEPGKTYYIFSNTTGLGIAGFYFEPYVNHDGTERGRINIGVREMKLSASAEYALPDNVSGSETIYSPNAAGGETPYTIHYSNKAVKVNLRRAFHKDQWETICLPYSMNQVQMEQVFGEGTRVVLLRDIQDREHSVDNKVTLTLVCHENQDIIAGYPYLIRPTQDALNGVVTIASLPETNATPSLVEVSSVGPNTNSYTNKTYGGMGGYTFKGHYGGNANVNEGSYAVKDGKFCRVKTSAGNGTTISGYRAWLQNDGEGTLAKAITSFNGIGGEVVEDDIVTDNEEISIDKLLESQGIFTEKTTVYSVNGQVVRQNAENLNNLPKGIYIVNGKKYIIK